MDKFTDSHINGSITMLFAGIRWGCFDSNVWACIAVFLIGALCVCVGDIAIAIKYKK